MTFMRHDYKSLLHRIRSGSNQPCNIVELRCAILGLAPICEFQFFFVEKNELISFSIVIDPAPNG